MKVSVLMPVYNTDEKYLRESIKSILEQTFTDFELLICDDGSASSPRETAESFSDPRIKFLQNERNLGVSATRNRLMATAVGEYIAWQDADDISMPDRLGRQVLFLDENPDFSGVSGKVQPFPHGLVSTPLLFPKILDSLGGCKFINNCAMLRIKNFRDNALQYDPGLKTSEDYDLWVRAMVKGLKFANLPEILLKYRRVSTSLVHLHGSAGAQNDREIKKFILDQLTDDPVLRREIAAVVARCDRKKCSWGEWLFSIRNEWRGLNKVKIMQILGIRVKLSVKPVK